MTIYFYGAKDHYGCFSNFSLHGFFLEGNYWKTVEHYFQAQKFLGNPYSEIIRFANKPKDAAQLGKTRKHKLREDWENVKDEIMLKGVLEKFKTHHEIREILLATGQEAIIENSPYDYYWGIGKDGSGKNRLGKILMQVRLDFA